MTIRPAALTDADAIARLMTELGYTTSASQMATRLASILPDPSYRTLVACDGETIVGVVGTRTGPMFEFDDPYGQIMVLSVAAAHRRRGVGGLLVQAAEACFADRKARFAVVTSAHRRADAHAFYEKHGYTFDGRRCKKPLGSSAL